MFIIVVLLYYQTLIVFEVGERWCVLNQTWRETFPPMECGLKGEIEVETE